MPIVHISRPWGASCPSIADDLALLTPIHPEVVASASKSLLDVSNLGKMSALSVSSPALAADLGGGFLWKRLATARGGKVKQANSKTRLLEQQQQEGRVQGSVDTLSTQISWSPTLHESWPVSKGFVFGGRVNFLGPVATFPFFFSSVAAGPASSSGLLGICQCSNINFLFSQYYLLISFSGSGVCRVARFCCFCGNPGILLFPHVSVILN